LTRRFSPYLLLLPQMAAFVIIAVFPCAFLMRLIFLRTDFISSEWVGLGNIVKLAGDRVFWKVIINTLIYMLLITSATTILTVLATLPCLDLSRKAQAYVRFVSMIPSMAAGMVVSSVWRWIFHPSVGLANWALGLFGIEPMWWFGSRWAGIAAISTVIVYGGSGQIVILMASALSLSRDIVEAAKIDGATPGQIRRYIVLPHMAPAIALIGTLAMIGVSQMWETVMMMSNGGPDYGTATLMFDIYETAFLESQFGYGSAKTLVLVLLVLVLALTKRRIERWSK